MTEYDFTIEQANKTGGNLGPKDLYFDEMPELSDLEKAVQRYVNEYTALKKQINKSYTLTTPDGDEIAISKQEVDTLISMAEKIKKQQKNDK